MFLNVQAIGFLLCTFNYSLNLTDNFILAAQNLGLEMRVSTQNQKLQISLCVYLYTQRLFLTLPTDSLLGH